MSEVSFPGGGQDGEQPPPAVPERDGTAGVPADDWDPDAEMAAYIADLEAGRARIPEEWELEDRPAVTISLGDAADVDPGELAAMLGPDGLGGEIFAQDRPADVMRPGPVLAALTEGAVADPARLGDDQLLGAISAARRLAARAEYLELAAVAEFTRRREAQVKAAAARKVRPGRRPGEFAAEELAMELVTSPNAARDTMDMACDLAARLPATSAALAAGIIDGYRARIIWRYTRLLTDADAAHADQVLAEAAPRLRADRLARKAIATAMQLDPEAMTRGKDQARKDRQRVTAFREESGNAALAARELAIEDALASKAHIDALAAALRRGGMAGTLRELRVLAFVDLTQGRDPLDRLIRRDGAADGGSDDYPHHDDDRYQGWTDDADGYRGGEDADEDEDEDGDGYCGDDRDAGGFPGDSAAADAAGELPGEDYAGAGDDDEDDWDEDDDPDAGGFPDDSAGDENNTDEDDGNGGDDGAGGPGSGPPGRPAPFPALINLIVPASTLFGWPGAPGEAGGWGLTDPGDTRRLVQAASMHSRTRWCCTLTGPDGTAVAHGCARGPRPWTPPPPGGSRDGPHTGSPPGNSGPDARQAVALADFLRKLNITLTPIATGTCDHASAEDRYTPSRKLGHLIRARTTTCPAPGCAAHAYHNDLDHTIAYPIGPTDQCNLSPPCRRHHRAKQAPGWQLSQPEPGVMHWATPSGRTYTTRPTAYET
jgi:Domain of unknown function (DUF222)